MCSRQFQILSRTQTKRFLFKHGCAALQVLNFKLPWIHEIWNNRGKTKGCMKHVRSWGMFHTATLWNILQCSSFPAGILEVPKRFPQDMVKNSLLKRRNWPWRGFNSTPLTLKKIGSLKETLTISQAVLDVNARRKQSGCVGVWRERVYDLCSAGVLLHPSEWCQDQLGSSVYSVRVLILVFLTSCFILKCGVILGFLSTFPHVIGLPSLMCSTCVLLSPLPHGSLSSLARWSRCYAWVVQRFFPVSVWPEICFWPPSLSVVLYLGLPGFRSGLNKHTDFIWILTLTTLIDPYLLSFHSW